MLGVDVPTPQRLPNARIACNYHKILEGRNTIYFPPQPDADTMVFFARTGVLAVIGRRHRLPRVTLGR